MAQPDWITAFLKQPVSGSGFDNRTYTDPSTGWVYQLADPYAVKNNGQNGETPDADYLSKGYIGTSPQYAGAQKGTAQTFDKAGTKTGEFQFDNSKDIWDKLAPMLPLLIGGGAALNGMGFLGGGAGGAAGGAGGFIGEGAGSGIGAWDSALASAAGGAPTTATMGAGAAGLQGSMDLGGGLSMGADGSIMGATPGATSAMSNADILASVGAGGGGASGGGGLMNSLTSGAKSLASSGLLGPAATVLGGLAGSKSKDSTQTSEKKMDSRLDDYVYGDLLPQVKGLLAQSMSPERLAQNDKLRQAGLGLLSQGAAGNGFSKYYGGK